MLVKCSCKLLVLLYWILMCTAVTRSCQCCTKGDDSLFYCAEVKTSAFHKCQGWDDLCHMTKTHKVYPRLMLAVPHPITKDKHSHLLRTCILTSQQILLLHACLCPIPAKNHNICFLKWFPPTQGDMNLIALFLPFKIYIHVGVMEDTHSYIRAGHFWRHLSWLLPS